MNNRKWIWSWPVLNVCMLPAERPPGSAWEPLAVTFCLSFSSECLYPTCVSMSPFQCFFIFFSFWLLPNKQIAFQPGKSYQSSSKLGTEQTSGKNSLVPRASHSVGDVPLRVCSCPSTQSALVRIPGEHPGTGHMAHSQAALCSCQQHSWGSGQPRSWLISFGFRDIILGWPSSYFTGHSSLVLCPCSLNSR